MQGHLLGELTPIAEKPAARPHATKRVSTQPEKICKTQHKKELPSDDCPGLHKALWAAWGLGN